MNAPATIVPAKPTLEQRLRFVDLSFECADEAHLRMPSRDPVQRQALMARLRLEAMEREGLPLSLLGDGKTPHQRHCEQMEERHGPGWNRAPLSSFADIGENARHPLQSATGLAA